ncbi:ParM/StbA family protein [Salinibacter altiplanensis]|nr:ParM/StbA family protein [Salinibacter altiplanensis]
MLKTKSFPSVFETNTNELVDVADDLLEGLKVQVDDEQYVVGDLALREGTAPHKGINNAPSDLDYRLLLRAGLLVAQAGGANTPLTLTTGFPYSAYRVHRRNAGNLIEGEQEIEFDGRPFGQGEHSVVDVDITDVEVLPEIEGHVTATREGDLQEDDPFFAVSLGYGTFESVLSLPSGPVQRTATSGHGLRYATSMMAERLREKHYLDMPTEHQIDMAMRRGTVVAGRQRYDLSELRQKVLRIYYNDIVSPSLKKAFDDNDFGQTRKMYLAGGGALYTELVDAFEDEFGDVLSLNVVPDPATHVSRGFALHSAGVNGKGPGHAVGLDLGNANTSVTLFEQERA